MYSGVNIIRYLVFRNQNVMSVLRKIGLRLTGENESGLKSYSQCGEDLIINFLYSAIGIEKKNYLDIGAFDPFHINNTAFFYARGITGVNVEPNPARIEIFKRLRKSDINVHAAVSDQDGTTPFFTMNPPTLSTIVKEEVHRLQTSGEARLVKESIVPQMKLQTLIDKYCEGRFPALLSIDTEGLEEMILMQLRQMSTSPIIICAETLEFEGNHLGRKKTDLIRHINEAGYKVYADTFVNTIFLREDSW
jgi:FkbM family methyltransferase